MKNILFVLILVHLYSCDNNSFVKDKNINNIEDKITPENSKVYKYIKEFKENNNLTNNDNSIRLEKGNELFRDSISLFLSSKNSLSDYPIKLNKVYLNSNNKAVANFMSESYLGFNLIGNLEEDVALNLVEGSTYLVYGEFDKFMPTEYTGMVKGSLYTPLIKIDSGILNDNIASLGIFTYKIDTIVEFKNK